MNISKEFSIIFGGLFLAVGVALAGYFVGQTIYNSKVAMNTAEVKGLAERRVSADIATWDIKLRVSGQNKSEIPKLYSLAEEQQKLVTDLLQENGVAKEEIEVGVFNYSVKEYRDKSQVLVDQKHFLQNKISVETKNVEKLRSVRVKLNALVAKGLDIQNDPPRYLFTKLNEVKPSMLQEATKNARTAAEEFASNAGVKVGRIRSARQGSFYVRDVGSDYSDHGKIEKNARVVSTITFYLE